jgi:hypothetical protein
LRRISAYFVADNSLWQIAFDFVKFSIFQHLFQQMGFVFQSFFSSGHKIFFLNFMNFISLAWVLVTGIEIRDDFYQ